MEFPADGNSPEGDFNFWLAMARHFAGNSTVAFFDLFNEPTSDFGQLGNLWWEKWKTMNEDLIKLISDNSIPLVAGFDWAYDLTPLSYAPINAEGIAYTVHPCPHKRTPLYEPKWDEDFGFAAEKYPVVAPELGFTLGKGGMEDNGEYGKEIVNYMKSKHISWVWWVFDRLWRPTMLQAWKTFKPTDNVKFFKAAAHGRIQCPDSTEGN